MPSEILGINVGTTKKINISTSVLKVQLIRIVQEF
jgi:hypothetical protein